ncbi:MAG: hypothetical protein H6Q70_122 [Firmicutes bacterium]|nr:hypothetical protein [Bacillota bacterium]
MFLTYGPFTIQFPFTVQSKLFYFNETASLPRGLYLKVPIRNLQDGDYVVYELTADTKKLAVSRQWIKEDEMFLKKIGAMPNETYCIDPDTLQFFANGKYVGQVFLEDRKQLPMPVLRGAYVVGEDEFLPVADNPRSFDGRYTGTVPIENIKSKVIPLLTEFHW